MLFSLECPVHFRSHQLHVALPFALKRFKLKYNEKFSVSVELATSQVLPKPVWLVATVSGSTGLGWTALPQNATFQVFTWLPRSRPFSAPDLPSQEGRPWWL